MTTRFWCWGAVVAALILSAAYPPKAAAARPLTFTIQVDGKDYLGGIGGDNGEGSPAAVWRRLTSTELKTAPGADISPDASDPLRATIRGDITIDVTSAGKANVKELRLVRQSATAGWMVDSQDVERIGKEMGLSETTAVSPAPPTPGTDAKSDQSSPKSMLMWIGVGLAAALFVSGIMVSRLRRGMPPRIVEAESVPYADADNPE